MNPERKEMKSNTRRRDKSIRAMTAKWHADRYGENEACREREKAKAMRDSEKREHHV